MGWILTVAFLITGLLVEVFTAGLFLGIHRERGFGLGLILLVCFGFGLLLIGAFRTDVPGLPPTVDGKIHGIVANTVFLLLPIANLLFSPSLKAKFWRPLFVYSIVTAFFAIIWIAIYRLLLPAELSWFGLYERILVITEVVWVEVMAVWLLRLSLKLVRTTHPAFAVPAYQAADDKLGLEV